MSDERDRTQELVARLAAGEAAAAEELSTVLYGELRRIAERCMADERGEHTLQPTALVHEAYLRLFESGAPTVEGRVHFLRLAAKAMRHVLIDHARGRAAKKRSGGKQREALDLTLESLTESMVEVIDVDTALGRLEQMDAELGRLVELRFFGGLTHAEIAELEGISVPTVERRWRVARSWLRGELERPS